MANRTIDDGPFRVTVIDDIEYVRITMPNSEIEFDLRRLPDLIALLTQAQATVEDPCSYTFAHTRHWCGHVGCRDS